MESITHKLFIHQWQRKLVALFTATLIWIFVSHSITSTKTIPSVPIRVINLPVDKTIHGLLPNGFLAKRTTLTLSGTKEVIDQLEQGDIEIIVDVSNQPNEGIIQITKKNLVSLNPNFNLPKHITSVTHPEFILKMSPILNDKIPIYIYPPEGLAPKGYEFLDVWPVKLMQTVSGPQDEVLNLKNQGLELKFNLNDISKEQLDAIQGNGLEDDEINFYVPDLWKKIKIPFSNRGLVAINDPESKMLHLSFLRQHLLPIKNSLPIHVFYPLKYSAAINPNTYALAPSPYIEINHDIPTLKLPLFASNVSKLFLEIVKDNIELEIVASPQSEREKLEWGIGFIDDNHLEDTYVAFLLSNLTTSPDHLQTPNREQENHFRQRFRSYLQRLALFLSPQHEFEIESRLEENKIRVHIPNASLNIPNQP